MPIGKVDLLPQTAAARPGDASWTRNPTEQAHVSFPGTKTLPEASHAGVPRDGGYYNLPSVRFHQPSTKFHSLVVLPPPNGVLHYTLLPELR